VEILKILVIFLSDILLIISVAGIIVHVKSYGFKEGYDVGYQAGYFAGRQITTIREEDKKREMDS